MNKAKAERVELTTNTKAPSLPWPDLSKDEKAVQLAKSAMGWYEMTAEQQMDATRYMLKLAQEFKQSL